MNFTKKVAALCLAVAGFVSVNAQTAFYEEDFGAGIPAGWTSEDAAQVGAVWEWCDDASQGIGAGCVDNWATYSDQHGDFAASTADNGFMVMDSDGLGSIAANHIARLTAAPVDCSAQTAVWVKFEALIGVFGNTTTDLAVLRVSNNGGTDWTEYNLWDIAAGNTGNEAGSIRWSVNPSIRLVDISDVAAGQSEVLVQWEWEGNYEYYYLLDDVQLYDSDPSTLFLPANDLQVNSNFFAIAPSAQWPLAQAETFNFLADVQNNGLNDATGVSLNVTVTDDGNNVLYTDDLAYGLIEADSIVENVPFTGTGFLPTALGQHNIAYTITSDSTDEVADNNIVSNSFLMTDTLFAKEVGATRDVFPAAANWDAGEPTSWAYGNVFHIINANDEFIRTAQFSLTGADVAGNDVLAAVYKWTADDNADTNMDASERELLGFAQYTIQGTETAADLITLPVYTFLGDPIALEDNTDYAVVLEFNASDDQTNISFGASEGFDYGATIFLSTENGAPRYASVLGINGDLTTEAYSTVGFGTDIVPVVRMSTGEPITVSVDETLPADNLINIYPNPVADVLNVNVDFTANQEAVYMNIYDATGRVVGSKTLENVDATTVSFPTTNLAAGNYFLQVITAEGVRSLNFVK